MPRIHILDTHTANRIAAGEVVDRPASIVKELVENAIDAGASSITVEAKGGGVDLIRVRDDGCGIPEEELPVAFARHATSKISDADDLDGIATLGFRGEALASIAAIAQVTVRTCARDADMGALLRIEGGELKENGPAGCPQGTLMEVANVFYNTPARRKFLKSPRTEASLISDYVSRMMMAYPQIAFKLIQNDRTVYQSSGDGELKNVLFDIYGGDALPHLRPLEYDDGYIRITGFAGTEQLARNNRLAQSFYINHRYIKSQKLSYAIQRVYDTRLMHGKFPLIVLDICLNPREIDVNVHPNKLEVRFHEEERVLRAASAAVRRALGTGLIPNVLEADIPSTEPQTAQFGRAAEPLFARGSQPLPAAKTEEKDLPPRASIAEEASEAIHRQREPQRLSVHEAAQPIPVYHVPPRVVQPTAQVAFGSAPYQVVGQLFDCYWAVQQGDCVFFIDQHAAHERRLYESLMQKGVHADSQMLLLPDVVRLSAVEHRVLMENLPLFTEIGFDIEDFGSLSVSIRAVPHIIGQPQTLAFLHDAIDMLEAKNKLNTAELKRDALIQSACKHAIKAGAKLSGEEIAALLDVYAQEGTPMTCPHGRPVMVRMQKTEFEKLFKRLL